MVRHVQLLAGFLILSEISFVSISFSLAFFLGGERNPGWRILVAIRRGARQSAEQKCVIVSLVFLKLMFSGDLRSSAHIVQHPDLYILRCSFHLVVNC